MFSKKDETGYIPALDGILRKTLAHGDKTLMTEFRLEKGRDLPVHSHPHEQIGYLVSGLMVLKVEDKEFEAGPGDAWCIPGGVEHGAHVLEHSVAIEVFAPVREDYL